MVFEKSRVNRLAAPESLVDAVPELDASLTHLPAKVNFFSLEQRREIDEAYIQILHQATEFLDSVKGFLERLSRRFPGVLLLHHLAAVHSHTARNGHALREALPVFLQPFVLGLESNNPANRRIHVGKNLFGLS